MPEWLFVDKRFHLVLLSLHILFLLISFKPWYFILEKYSYLSKQQSSPSSNLQLLLLPLFMSNFIGIVFARSLHYQVSMTKSISRKFWMTEKSRILHFFFLFQFYVWYYHQLPYLLWCTNLPTQGKLLILGLIELCWNVYPSENWSSGLLHFCHIILLVSLLHYILKIVQVSKKHLEDAKLKWS